MLVTIDIDGRPRPARLHLTPEATAAHLVEALTPGVVERRSGAEPEAPIAAVLTVDATPVPGDQRLLGLPLRNGAHLRLLRDDAFADPDAGHDCAGEGQTLAAGLAVTGGPDAGRQWTLPPGRWVLGRGSGAELQILDPTLDCAQVVLEVDTHGSVAARGRANTTNPTSISAPGAAAPGGRTAGDAYGALGVEPVALGAGVVLTAGATTVALVPQGEHVLTLAAPDPIDGRAPFDRPPARPPAPLPPLVLPPPPAPPGRSPALSWALLLGPLLVAAVLAAVFSPAMAVLALLGPVLTLASWWEQRRRARRQGRRAGRARARDLEVFADELTFRRAAEVLRRRRDHPDPGTLIRWARSPGARLWARRATDDLHAVLRLGVGRVRWDPAAVAVPAGRSPDQAQATSTQLAPAQLSQANGADPEVELLLADAADLDSVPVTVDIDAAGVLGLAGPRWLVVAAARALLVQAAVHIGPADIDLVCFGLPELDPVLHWLPHRPPRPDTDLGATGPARPTLVLVGDERPLSPTSPARRLVDHLGDAALVVALAPEVDQLPGGCGAVVDAGAGTGEATLLGRDRDTALVLDGLSSEVAETAARALARLRDPEDEDPDTALPAHVHLAELVDTSTPAAVRDRWQAGGGRPVAMLGVGTSGPVSVDLVRDGPHALVGGTTGSGKSELLRTLVVSLALHASPEDLTFVLVDFKGGAAFDACAALPHVVGLVTDLDGGMGTRTIRSLDAELRRRERLLRAASVTDVDTYRRERAGRPELPALPRLVLVVDEFAALARDEPAVLEALVDLAQRGRSLGMHLVLATQRPAGVVNEHIRTNSDLRIALRMLEAGDSHDVLGSPQATTLPVDRPGRALVGRGAGGRAVAFQVAVVANRGSDSSSRGDSHPQGEELLNREHPSETRPSGGSPGENGPGGQAVTVTWLDSVSACPPSSATPTAVPDTTPQPGDPPPGADLASVVDTIRQAWARPGATAPHRPWTPPLPAVLEMADLVTMSAQAPADTPGQTPGHLVYGLADDPDHQRRVRAVWAPAEGPLVVVGQPGSGRSTALATLAAAAAGMDPIPHVYVVGDPGTHADLVALPHVGAVIATDDGETLARLEHLMERCARDPAMPPLLVLVDGLPDLLATLDTAGGPAAVDRWMRLCTEHRRRVATAFGAPRVTGIPGPLLAATPHRLALALPDPYDYTALGLPALDSRGWPAGRGWCAATGLAVQVALPPPIRSGRQPQAVAPPATPDPLSSLPARVSVDELGPPPEATALALGLGDEPRRAVWLTLSPGDHLLVAGPDCSGRSTTLAGLATAADRAGYRVVACGPARSPLRHGPTHRWWVDRPDLDGTLDTLATAGEPAVVVVDDADLVGDPGGLLGRLATDHGPVHLLVATHRDRLRGAYGHWTAPLGLARWGLALHPGPGDGALWATTVPVGPPGRPPGRGYLLEHGKAALVQVACP